MAISGAVSSSEADTGSLNIHDITCPITQDVFIEPFKTNCEHRVEKLALARLLREDKRCPVCREVVTSATLDEELVQKIQNQFIRIHGVVNEENSRLFYEQKASMDNDPVYESVRGQSVVPEISTSRRPPVWSWSEIFRSIATEPRVEGPDIVVPRAESPYNQVMNCIRADNLDQAEIITDRMAYQQNECYKKIVDAYIIKADSDVHNIQLYLNKAILVTVKISISTIKNDLLLKISFKYLGYKKFLKAFQTVKKIDSFVLRFINRIVICTGAMIHGFMLTLKMILLPFRVLLARIRY